LLTLEIIEIKGKTKRNKVAKEKLLLARRYLLFCFLSLRLAVGKLIVLAVCDLPRDFQHQLSVAHSLSTFPWFINFSRLFPFLVFTFGEVDSPEPTVDI
jgi:hypothetical protein